MIHLASQIKSRDVTRINIDGEINGGRTAPCHVWGWRGGRSSDRVDEPRHVKSPDIYRRRKRLSMCLSGCRVVHLSLTLRLSKNAAHLSVHIFYGKPRHRGPASKCTVGGVSLE